MFCTKCGRKLVDGREICSVCGAVNKTTTNALWPQLEELLSQKMVAIVAWILTAVLAVGNVCTWIPSGLSLGVSHRTAMGTTKEFVTAMCKGDSKGVAGCCIFEYGMVGGNFTTGELMSISTKEFQDNKVGDFEFISYGDNCVFALTDDYIVGVYCSKVDGEYLISELLLSEQRENMKCTDIDFMWKHLWSQGTTWGQLMQEAGVLVD